MFDSERGVQGEICGWVFACWCVQVGLHVARGVQGVYTPPEA